MRTTRMLLVVAPLVGASLVLAACSGGKDSATSDDTGAGTDPTGDTTTGTTSTQASARDSLSHNVCATRGLVCQPIANLSSARRYIPERRRAAHTRNQSPGRTRRYSSHAECAEPLSKFRGAPCG